MMTKKAPRLPWTDPERDVLRKMCEKGFSPEEISAHVLKTRTPNGIRSQMTILGIKTRLPEPVIDMEAYNTLVVDA